MIKVFKSEIIDMIRKMTGRNKNRLTLPIIKGKGSKSKAEEYRRFHHAELNTHRVYREVFKGMIEDSDKRITPKKWQEELDNLKADYQKNRIRCSDITLHLAKIEVLSYNKRDLERMLENESHKINHDPGRKRNVVDILRKNTIEIDI